MVEYRFRISGVHYAANPEAEAGMPDTEEMHVRTREMLSCPDLGHPHPLSQNNEDWTLFPEIQALLQ